MDMQSETHKTILVQARFFDNMYNAFRKHCHDVFDKQGRLLDQSIVENASTAEKFADMVKNVLLADESKYLQGPKSTRAYTIRESTMNLVDDLVHKTLFNRTDILTLIILHHLQNHVES